jgi:hypothetical protein
MAHALGCYYAPEHSRQQDRDYIAALQPPVIRILDPDVQQIVNMHALAPGAILLPRIWSIDDNNGQAVRDLMADPQGTGRRHADQYRAQLIDWYSQASLRGLTMPPSERIMFNAANEPNQGGTPDKIAAYSVAFLNQCKINGVRAAALCLGVGWPDNTGPDTPVNWQPYADAGLVEAITRGFHWLELHEYFYKTGPQDGWRWLAGRSLQCPFDVPILLGEIGCDNYVDKPRWDREGGNRGWQGNVAPDTYAEMIEYHIRNSDKRVVAALPFITDYRNNEWQSFDTAAAHNALLARKDRMVPQHAQTATTPPVTTLLPSISTPPTPAQAVAYIAAPSGANLRNAPVDGNVLVAVPYGEQIAIVGVSDNAGWVRVRYGNHEGWMASNLITLTEPQPAPTPPPVGIPDFTPPPPPTDTWQRSRAFVAKWEGGYQNVQNDAGNWTGCAVGKGELKGTKYGISACSYPQLDIQNLTMAEADAIYFRDYWQKSGAAALPWPLCLLVFDTAVLHGVGTARQWQQEVGTDAFAFAAKRLRVYTKMSNWDFWGKAWVNRVADLLEEMSK